MIRTSEDVFMRIYGTDGAARSCGAFCAFIYFLFAAISGNTSESRGFCDDEGGGVALNSCLPIWKRHSLIGELRNGNEKQVAAFLNYSEQFRAEA